MFDMYMLVIVAILLFIVGGLWWHLLKEIDLYKELTMIKEMVNSNGVYKTNTPFIFRLYAGAAGSTAYTYLYKETLDAYRFTKIKLYNKNSNVSYIKLSKDSAALADMVVGTEYDISDITTRIEIVLYASGGNGSVYFEMY